MPAQLLEILTLEQLLAAPYGKLPCKDIRRADRAFEECRPAQNEVTFLWNPTCNYTEASVHTFTSHFDCLASWEQRKDKPGHLNHNDDHVWALCGPHTSRLVCFQDSIHNFQVLQVFVCETAVRKKEYSDYISDLELRWYGLKKQHGLA